MVKWWNTVVKWCNNKDLHIIVVKWCNVYGEMVQIIHTSSHGKMVKHSSGDILFAKWLDSETVLYSPSSALSFTAPSDDGDRASFLTPWSAAFIVSASVISGWCHIDRLILPRADPAPFGALSPRCFRSIHFSFTFFLPLPTSGGFVPFAPFCNLLVLAIALCSYTGDILYSLCATIIYKTFASAVWSHKTAFRKSTFRPP